MKPLWIGPFTIPYGNYNCNKYSFDLSSNPHVNLIYNTFHIDKIKPNLKNNSNLFLQRHQEKPGPVSQERYEV